MNEQRRGFFGRFRNRESEEEAEPVEQATETVEKASEPEASPPAEPERAPAEEQTSEPKRGWVQRLRHGLSRSSNALTGSISSIFTKKRLDEATLEEFEEALIRADLGVDTAVAYHRYAPPRARRP